MTKLTIVFMLATAALFARPVAAQTESVLYSFPHYKNGYPNGALLFDSAGNLYGTAGGGGVRNKDYGMVFELEPVNGWTLNIARVFDFKDGAVPTGGLISDASGNVYGTTYQGGAGLCQQSGSVVGCGTVFELSPKIGGGWTEKVLHSFSGTGDGYGPSSGVIMDAAGNLYGTAPYGGPHTGGVVFELSPKVGGGWTETVLCVFGHFYNSNGAAPYGGLVLAGGNLYGTTESGGAFERGTVFELSPKTGGGWAETVLYSFAGGIIDGQTPYSEVIFDGSGNLYGTTANGGIYQGGTAFELSPSAGGWIETILHSFAIDGADGTNPVGGLVFDAAGNLYGTTSSGGANLAAGTVFKLAPAVGGWTLTTLYNFNPNNGDAHSPFSTLILDASGNLYGTTGSGGAWGFGAVFEVTP